jgi:spore maturation protein CgeB
MTAPKSKIVVFGLTISSSWGNGHATLWRGLCKALAQLGHDVVFFERNVPYYAGARDLDAMVDGELVLYDDWTEVLPLAQRHCSDADVAIVTSYCSDAIAATQVMLDSGRPLTVFYDLDTPVTLDGISRGIASSYVPAQGLGDFDLVLSYTGGAALDELQHRLGARHVQALYGHVDPDVHRPMPPVPRYRADLSYMGTYASDRQAALEQLFIAPARCRPAQRFVLAGAQYPQEFPWTDNIHFVRHLPPGEHAELFSSSRCTLNITRSAMARMGWCPSGRLFEAAACGTVVLSDAWPGLEEFYVPGAEILLVRDTEDVLTALQLSDAELQRIAERALDRTLREHTAVQRARQLLQFCEDYSAYRSGRTQQQASKKTSLRDGNDCSDSLAYLSARVASTHCKQADEGLLTSTAIDLHGSAARSQQRLHIEER